MRSGSVRFMLSGRYAARGLLIALGICWLATACGGEPAPEAGGDTASAPEAPDGRAGGAAAGPSMWSLRLGEEPEEFDGTSGTVARRDSLLALHLYGAEGTNVHLVLDDDDGPVRDGSPTPARRGLIAVGDLTCRLGGPDGDSAPVDVRFAGETDGLLEGSFRGTVVCSDAGGPERARPVEGEFRLAVPSPASEG